MFEEWDCWYVSLVVVFVSGDEVESVLECVEVVECSFGDGVGCCVCCAWGEGRESKEAECVVVGVLDWVDKSADVDSVGDEVESCFGNDVVDGELLLEDVWCEGGVGHFDGEPKFDPDDRAVDGVDIRFAAFDDAGSLAVKVVAVHDCLCGFVVPEEGSCCFDSADAMFGGG